MEGNYLINIERVKEDTAYMAKEAVSQNLVVHCEVKLLTHILKPKPKLPALPKHTPISVFRSSPVEVVKPFSNHSMPYTEPALQPKVT